MERQTKLTKNHGIYEIWCEWTAESVYWYVHALFEGGKPSKEEVEEIVQLNWPQAIKYSNLSLKEFVKKHVKVEKLPRVYTEAWEDPATI